jgi:hypothetical protein
MHNKYNQNRPLSYDVAVFNECIKLMLKRSNMSTSLSIINYHV